MLRVKCLISSDYSDDNLTLPQVLLNLDKSRLTLYARSRRLRIVVPVQAYARDDNLTLVSGIA
jgi:hypothetical protein